MKEQYINETAKLLRKENAICQKCNCFIDGECNKPIFDSCNNDEDILSACETLYENNYFKLPCKVGDVVYAIEFEYGILKKKKYFIAEYGVDSVDDVLSSSRCLMDKNSLWYINKQEAEAKLQELNGLK